MIDVQAKVNTATGEVPVEDLGLTLMHEHIFVCQPFLQSAYGDRWLNRAESVERGVQQAKAAKAHGVDTIVDLTYISSGRDITLLREVAEKAEVHIIASVGLSWVDEPWLDGWEVDRLVDLFSRDITVGIQDTDDKAGIIKAATDRRGVTANNRRKLQIAARMHRATGVPISTHTHAELRTGLGQQDVFEEEGVDLSRVVIGHCGETEDLEYLETLLRRGSFIGMDRFGQGGEMGTRYPTEKRVSITADLCRRGYANQIVLSHDACCTIDYNASGTLENARLDYVPAVVLPALRQEGVTEEQIRMMTIDNPRRLFEKRGAY